MIPAVFLAVIFLCGQATAAVLGWELLTDCGPAVLDDCGVIICPCEGSHSHVGGQSTGARP